MRYLYKVALSVASAAFFIVSAQAQNSTVTNHAFAIGKGPGVSGYTSLLCGSAQLAVGQSAADPICRTLSGDVTLNSSGVTAIGAGKVTSSMLASGAVPVFASRAAAAALDLSAFTFVRTMAYSSSGYLGGATFKNIGSSPVVDSFVSTFSITGGTGYTNGGPYYGALFQNSSRPYVIGTVTVSGGAITAVDVSGSPGNQCKVGEVYQLIGSAADTSSPANGLPSGGSGASITVTGCSVPLGSFTDVVGNNYQLVPDPSGANIAQFGAVGDWNGSDGTATDNFDAAQACLWSAGFKSTQSYDVGGYWGGACLVPQGSFMICGVSTASLIVANGVRLVGQAETGSTLSFCAAKSAATILIELGDPNWHFACFMTSLWHLEVRSSSGTGYMVHSNCSQDFGGVYQTAILSNGASGRGCLHYEKSYGGGSSFTIWKVTCGATSNFPMVKLGNTDASGLNLGTTVIDINTLVTGGSSSGLPVQAAPALQILGGWVTGVGIHCEGAPACVQIDISATAAGTVDLKNITGGNGNPNLTCTGVVQFGPNNYTGGNNQLGQVQAAATCTHVVENGMSGGSHYNDTIVQSAKFNPNYTSY
ncbi:hypothetical protein [Bradyrhizobium sp. 930_D9_N1_4]|uniref:hypothetical protein n=1 Tax=Bradyrhizobium sp. 930_D9_N1_4 TaxID=3240374 RepID=UPI003F8CCB9E